MSYDETPFFFDCENASLLGVLSSPAVPARVALIIVVGGPQYRVGSHRQFVLLARALASQGVTCLRFDYRGMGDSGGDTRDFEHVEADISAAIEALLGRTSGVDRVVLWGLCDGASASVFAAGRDARVAGLVLFNPWVRTEAGAAQALLKQYYIRRLFTRAFWRKLFAGEIQMTVAGVSLFTNLRNAIAGNAHASAATAKGRGETLPERVGRGLARYGKPTLIVLSGNDQTAAEFQLMAARPGPLADAIALKMVSKFELTDADHTLSRSSWQDEGARLTLEWLRSRFPESFAGVAGANAPDGGSR